METKSAPPANAAPPARKESDWRETLRFLLFLFIGAVLLRSLIAAPFHIPSGSMLPRMMIGDYLLVAKWPYGYSRYSFPLDLIGFEGRVFGNAPERGDVAVFRYPGGGPEFVKRVIGLPGDTVQIRGGQLILNGKPVAKTRVADFLMPVTKNSPCRMVDESRRRLIPDADGRKACAYPRYRETLPGGRSYEVIDQAEVIADDTALHVVPEGHYFVMGDNRDDSMDSRFTVGEQGVGYLPADHLIGRALVTFFSTDGSASWIKPWTWFSAARWERIGKP
jgi:signal peptidase I